MRFPALAGMHHPPVDTRPGASSSFLQFPVLAGVHHPPVDTHHSSLGEIPSPDPDWHLQCTEGVGHTHC
eukprot:1190224-Alexandrium_andersonii.AAC.1